MTAAYSLLELLFSLAIILILISAVTFSPNEVIAEYRLNQYAQALIMSLRLARSKAINQAQIGNSVTYLVSSPPFCYVVPLLEALLVVFSPKTHFLLDLLKA